MSRLKEKREAAGLSQGKLAKASGVNKQMICFYEQGAKDINKAQALTIYRLAQTIGCRMEDLIETDSQN